MEISLIDSVTRQVSVAAIAGYQKHISPHKGFSCAHRVLYGGESCSQYIKRVIATKGLKAAFVMSRDRFQACKQANQILRSQIDDTEPPEEGENPDNTEKRQRKLPPLPQPARQGINGQNSCNTSDCGNNPQHLCDCADISCNTFNFAGDCFQSDRAMGDCGSHHCHLLDCGSLDCSGVDCGSLDCSGADCNFLDCGSCGS
jgi:putative component of membrane protein insertase Oxa1/YidC/SpoIIIJ protein YidD